ncbi:unnamed protein product [Parnassius apollo]|uniref:(apollo) hypothetical protein n=1 Tax=Parnassius apollo TaxID=110799 RepID=A0A8S3XXK2_PARAO|nr:unnamed protein product [Parnassius apollo]
MHADFIEKQPGFKISYDFYRKVVKSLNISFTQLGHEECEICEAHKIHCKSENHDKDSIFDDCVKCLDYRNHKSRALKARKLYLKHKEEKENEPNHIYYSTDLEKVIMLPRLETFKEVVFCQRLVAFNQTFAPIGKSNTNPYAVLWHEAITGRKQEDIISAFNVFLMQSRDYNFIDLWLDNCAAQNKNWLLYFYLVHIINSSEISAKQVNLNYFESGHTFMSCDHFHHQVELSMKRKKKLHDFQDFIEAVSAANTAKVTVKEMKTSDFINVIDYTSPRRIQTSNPRAYMRNMVQVIFKRGSFNLFYKTDFDGEVNELTFLKDTYLKSKTGPVSVITSRTNPRCIKTSRKENILKKLSKFMLPYKQTFWKNLPTKDNEKD